MAKTGSHAVTIEDYERTIRAGSFKPVCLFTGAEGLLIDEAVDLLLNTVVEESARAFNLDVFYGTDAEARHIVSIASAYPMMAERRAVLVREFDKLADKEAFIPYLEHPSPSTCLVLISAKTDFRQKIYKAIEQNGTVFEFTQLYEERIPDWIVRRIIRAGKKATPDACQLLVSSVGRSLREIQNEIDKLFIYVGEKQTIGMDDVSAVVGLTKMYNIFELQKSIGGGDLARSMEIVERMLDGGESPVKIVAGLTKYFQRLWLAHEVRQGPPQSRQTVASRLNVKEFFLDAYLEASRRYPDDRIERCFSALAAADEALKSTPADHRMVMTLMVYNLMKGSESVL